MIFTHMPKYSAQAIEDRLHVDAKKIGLGIKQHFAFSKNLPEAGFDINEYASVFELCKIPLAAKVLNIQPELSIFMPCRINVYEKDAKVFVSTPNIEVMIEAFECDQALKKDILELYANIVTMIKSW